MDLLLREINFFRIKGSSIYLPLQARLMKTLHPMIPVVEFDRMNSERIMIEFL